MAAPQRTVCFSAMTSAGTTRCMMAFVKRSSLPGLCVKLAISDGLYTVHCELSVVTVPSLMKKYPALDILETVCFYFQTNRERKIENKKFGRKKGFLSFYSVCMFVCVCVCVCVFVCLFVCWRSTDVIV